MFQRTLGQRLWRVARPASAGASPVEDGGLDHYERHPRPDDGPDAEVGKPDRDQKDGRNREAPDQEKAHGGGVLGSSSSRPFFVEYQWMAVKNSLPTASVPA